MLSMANEPTPRNSPSASALNGSRGAGGVRFNPPQFKAWEDTRNNADSPFSPGWETPEAPPMGKWVVQATFDTPGTYVLRGLAHDGGLMAHEDVTFVVK